MRMIDPPEGWRYGFPKEYTNIEFDRDEGSGMKRWLVENGYPQKVIDQYKDHFYIRMWDDLP